MTKLDVKDNCNGKFVVDINVLLSNPHYQIPLLAIFSQEDRSVVGRFALGTLEELSNGHIPLAAFFDPMNVSISTCVLVPLFIRATS